MTMPNNSFRPLAAIAFILTWTLAGAAAAAAGPATLPGDLASWQCLGSCGSSVSNGDISLSPLGSARYAFVTTSGSMAMGASPLQLDQGGKGNGTENNGSRFSSRSFSAAAGEVLEMRFNFVSTDGKGFDDYAWARVVNASDDSLVAWLFTARSSNSSTGKIVPGDVVRKAEFDPDTMIVGFKDFAFNSKDAIDPVDWSPLGDSNRTCWEDNAKGCGFTGWLQSRLSFAQEGSFRVEVGVVNWGDTAYDSGLAFDFVGLNAGSTSPVPEPSGAVLLLLGLLALGAAHPYRRRGGVGRAGTRSTQPMTTPLRHRPSGRP
jgi:hypothetical protein